MPCTPSAPHGHRVVGGGGDGLLTGWPSIFAVILNYVKRSDVRGTHLDRTSGGRSAPSGGAFWVMGAIVLMLTIVGIPLAWLMVVATGFWVLYRHHARLAGLTTSARSSEPRPATMFRAHTKRS